MNLDYYFEQNRLKKAGKRPRSTSNDPPLNTEIHHNIVGAASLERSPDAARSQSQEGFTHNKKSRHSSFNYNDASAIKRLNPEASSGDLLPSSTFTSSRAQPRNKVSTLSVEDDDSDELNLLLGSQEARQVKAREKKHSDDFVFDPAEARTIRFRNIPWSTLPNLPLRDIAEQFKKQLEYELKMDSSVFYAFEPFFRDRVLNRIEKGSSFFPQFERPPLLCSDHIEAVPGYALRDYQIEGVQFLLGNFHKGLSCILSDDMGLGKTAQISAFLSVLLKLHHIPGPHLIVAPLSTITSWARELARWAPKLRVVRYQGEKKSRLHLRAGHANRHSVFITTPSILNQDKGFFRKRTWVVVIMDEAHILKGKQTLISNTARKLVACYKVAVTGTPVHNNVRDVWGLMGFLYPQFCAEYDASATDPLTEAQECASVLKVVMLRRTKEGLEMGIPPRIDEPLVLLDATYVQRTLLYQLSKRALQETPEEANSAANLQLHLTHQRVVCNHPLLIRLLLIDAGSRSNLPLEAKMRKAEIEITEESLIRPSAKMVYLDSKLKELKAGGHRCLIFSNFTSTLDLLEAFCHLRGYSYERLDGGSNRVERELAIIRFNASNSSRFIFLITTTAGGVGVTLTGADTVILFDSHFNPQMDRQAADRAHRIGQTRTVRVYRLCLRNTMEENIRRIAERKASLGDFIVDGGGSKGSTANGLSSDEIRKMFQFSQQNTLKTTSSTHEPDTACAENAETFSHQDGKMLSDLMEIIGNGELGYSEPSSTRRCADEIGRTSVCFACGEIMRPLEPLLHCNLCPKAYHADCINEPKPQAGVTKMRHWSCPRHECSICNKLQSADGSIFMCVSCPRSFCFDCLDPRYFSLDDRGHELVNISPRYYGMEEEGMPLRRSNYYVTCLKCSGVLSSSSSSSADSGDDDSDDDNDDDDDDEDAVLDDSTAENDEEGDNVLTDREKKDEDKRDSQETYDSSFGRLSSN